MNPSDKEQKDERPKKGNGNKNLYMFGAEEPMTSDQLANKKQREQKLKSKEYYSENKLSVFPAEEPMTSDKQSKTSHERTNMKKSEKKETERPPSHRDQRAHQEERWEDNNDEDDKEDETVDEKPGAVRVGRGEFDEDLEQGDSILSFVSTVSSTGSDKHKKSLESPVFLEAELVEDNKNAVTEQERKRIEEETRTKIFGELGEVTAAEVVLSEDQNKDDTSKRSWICGGLCLLTIVVLVVALGLAFDTNPSAGSTELSTGGNVPKPTPVDGGGPISSNKPTSMPVPSQQLVTSAPTSLPPTVVPTTSPTNSPPLNSQCFGASILKLGGIVNATVHSEPVLAFACYANSNNPPLDSGINAAFFYWQGSGSVVHVDVVDWLGGDPTLSIYAINSDFYPSCSEYFACLSDAIYVGKLSASFVSQPGQEYLFQVSSYDFVAPVEAMTSEEYTVGLRLQTNDSCESALGPIEPSPGNEIFLGFFSIGNEATKDTTHAPACGSASEWSSTNSSDAAGTWYSIRGNGKTIGVSTCSLTDLDTQISVFINPVGRSCNAYTALQCIDGNDDSLVWCGRQSGVIWASEEEQVYHVLVQSPEEGDFRLQISTEGQVLAPGNQCSTAIGLQPNSTRTVPLIETGTEDDPDIRRICEHPINFGGAFTIWHKVEGTGSRFMATLSVQSIYVDMLFLTGASCSEQMLVGLPDTCCEERQCIGDGTPKSMEWESEVGQTYYIVIRYAPGFISASEATLSLSSTTS